MSIISDARSGIKNDSIYEVSQQEDIEYDKLCSLIDKGLVTIPKNINRNTKPTGIGQYMRTKINANIGTSRDFINVENEIEKANVAVRYGADTVMDLSTGGDLDYIREQIMASVRVPVGTVPLYDAATRVSAVVEMDEDDMFSAVRRHGKQGVDFITVHSGITKNTAEKLMRSDRLCGVVSRGGSFTVAWMHYNDKENPFYQEFDYLLEIAAEYDMTLSLGDGMRSGCIHDAGDAAMYEEVLVLGELVKRSRKAGVQTFVEGPGHVSLDQIETCVRFIKKTTHEAPLYLLGPLVTDIAPGYDHITSAIGASVAGMAGSDFMCMVSPAEHLALPTAEDIKEGIIATKIAAHATDLIKRGPHVRAKMHDYNMSQARKSLDWKAQYTLSIEPEKPEKIRDSRKTDSKACSMCGNLCALQMVDKWLKNKDT